MRKTIAVDVDGVLADYMEGWKGVDNIGDPIPGAVEFTQALGKFADVLIFTTRTNPEMQKPVTARLLSKKVQEWLDKHGFYYDDIWIGEGKPVCSAIVDDRAVSCDPQSADRSTSFKQHESEVRVMRQKIYESTLVRCKDLVNFHHTKPKSVKELCEEFIAKHKVSCPESIMQVDSIQEALPDLLEAICDKVGYHVDDEG
jgi:hypothetical protein